MSAALHAVGRGDEAIEFLDDAVRRLPALAIYRDENFLERQQAALDRTLPLVFLNTLFKSASMYIATRLEVGLNLPRCYMTQAVLSGDRIIPSWRDLEPTGLVIRYEKDSPSEMIHMDFKKLGRFDRVGHHITGDRHGQSNARASARSSSMSRSMTTPAWPSVRSARARGRNAAWPSRSQPWPGTNASASGSSGR